MTPEQLKEACATAAACARKLRLPLRSRILQSRAGEFLGAGVGSSLDFQDHRAYVPGDDPRHINWQAFARTGHYTMKLYREEVRPIVDLVLDVGVDVLRPGQGASQLRVVLPLFRERPACGGLAACLPGGGRAGPASGARGARHTPLA